MVENRIKGYERQTAKSAGVQNNISGMAEAEIVCAAQSEHACSNCTSQLKSIVSEQHDQS